MWLASVVPPAVICYLGLGMVFTILFLFRGARRLDPRWPQGTFGFRCLMLHGCTFLWPLLLLRWLRSSHPTVEPSLPIIALQMERQQRWHRRAWLLLLFLLPLLIAVASSLRPLPPTVKDPVLTPSR